MKDVPYEPIRRRGAGLEKLCKLADTITNKTNGANNEAATKQTLIRPFLSALGYDVDNSGVLSSGYSVVGHSGNKKKIDYVLHADGKPNLVKECKSRSHSLNEKDLEQLDKYFGASEARFGLLTNGILFFHRRYRAGRKDGSHTIPDRGPRRRYESGIP